MLSISRNVWLRGQAATFVAGWLAQAEVALTHEPAADPIAGRVDALIAELDGR